MRSLEEMIVESEPDFRSEWMIEAEEALKTLGATGCYATFSGGNDSGSFDEVKVIYPGGRQEEVDYVDSQSFTWIPIGGENRPVHYSPLVHPRQQAINDLLNAVWTPIGDAHGGFATGEDAHVSGSVEVDLTEEDPYERFQFDEGEWVVTHYCIRGDCMNVVDAYGETCDGCAQLHWCTSCEEIEVDEAGTTCQHCTGESV